MAVLHERLPIATNFFRLKKKFREVRNRNGGGNIQSSSPVRTIASPKMIRGLSITKAMKKDLDMSTSPRNPDIRITKGSRQSEMSRR